MSVTLQKITTFVVVLVHSVGNEVRCTINGTEKNREVGRGLRLYNAVKAKSKDLPYVARIEVDLEDLPGRMIVCTGAIIHLSWVLSAAHCTKKKKVSGVQVYVGLIKVQETFEGSCQSRRAIKWIEHPEYTLNSDYDFLLLNMDQPFDTNEKVQVIPLSSKAWPQDEEMYERVCVVGGWGDIEGGIETEDLMFRDVRARHGTKGCKCHTPRSNKMLICVEQTTAGKICSSDSGGAIVCDGEAVGVVSHNFHPEMCNLRYRGDRKAKCESAINVFAYICPQLNWIAKTVPGIPSQPESCQSTIINVQLSIIIITTLIQFINCF